MTLSLRCWNRGVPLYIVYRGILISGCWNREVTLNTEVGVFISGCWNREVTLHSEVSSFQHIEIPLYTEVSRVEIEEFHCIQRCPRLE